MKKIFGIYILTQRELEALIRCLTSKRFSPSVAREASKVVEKYYEEENASL